MRALKISLTGLLLAIPLWVQAADDPTIVDPLRGRIQATMQNFIMQQSHDGVYPLYDPVSGQLMKLTLVSLHSGIVKKADYYVSCADFEDANGKVVDVDFMVVERDGKLHTQQAIVHKADGKKRPYHLE